MKFAREGYSTMAIAVLLTAIVCFAASFVNHWIAYVIYGVMVILLGLIVFFFRDPDRETPIEHNIVVAPADGKVVLVQEVEENIYLKGRATQISIFLSPLDVHVNRLPASGKVEYLEYHPGVYLMAWDHRASSMNERADFGILHPTGTKIFFRQITGFLARRIVYHIGKGDFAQAGHRFGMMKFGSRMDILVPPNVDVQVTKGDRTVAGETVIGNIRQGEVSEQANLEKASQNE